MNLDHALRMAYRALLRIENTPGLASRRSLQSALKGATVVDEFHQLRHTDAEVRDLCRYPAKSCQHAAVSGCQRISDAGNRRQLRASEL